MKIKISRFSFTCLYVILNMACQQISNSPTYAIDGNTTNIFEPSGKQLTDKEVLICNTTDVMEGFYFHDQLGAGKPITISPKDTFRIQMLDPTYLISSGLHQHFVKVMPADTVYIYTVGNKVHFKTSSNLLINKCLDDWFKSGDEIRYLGINPWYKTKMTMAERDKKVTDLYRARIAKLSQYNFNEAEELEMRQLLIGTLVNDKMFFLTSGLSRPIVKKYYADSIISWAKQLSMLSKDQQYLPTQFMHGASAIMAIYQENSSFAKSITFINTHFSYQLRDFLIANRINIKLQENEKETVDLNKMLGNTNISSYYMAKLQTKLEERNSFLANLSIKTDKTILTNRQGQVYNLDSLLSSRKNRLLYIDCWASWCMPCLAEMKHSQALQELYKDKAIDFVYLSMDKDKKAWLIAEKNLKLMNESNSFLVLDHFNSAFVKKHRINSIPRYMLLAADGKPISLDAPRPSDPKLKALINKYIQ